MRACTAARKPVLALSLAWNWAMYCTLFCWGMAHSMGGGVGVAEAGAGLAELWGGIITDGCTPGMAGAPDMGGMPAIPGMDIGGIPGIIPGI